MSRQQLQAQMGAKEIYNWMAYEMSIEPENYKRYIEELNREKALVQTAEEEARAVKMFLQSLSVGN